MVKGEVLIHNRSGLHARPASEFVAAATKFDSKIILRDLGDPSRECNAKSIVSLLTLGLTMGTRVEISAEGADEQQALKTLVGLVDGGFNDE